jgi:hypothetical protein
MQTYYGNAIFTNHAIQRLQERGITQSDAWYAFQHPDGQMNGNTPGSIKYYKNFGEQRIEVVAKLNEKKEWIILSCWSKIIGNGQSVFPQKKENPIWNFLKYFFSALTGRQ